MSFVHILVLYSMYMWEQQSSKGSGRQFVQYFEEIVSYRLRLMSKNECSTCVEKINNIQNTVRKILRHAFIHMQTLILDIIRFVHSYTDHCQDSVTTDHEVNQLTYRIWWRCLSVLSVQGIRGLSVHNCIEKQLWGRIFLWSSYTTCVRQFGRRDKPVCTVGTPWTKQYFGASEV